jgi:hypothetical protein
MTHFNLRLDDVHPVGVGVLLVKPLSTMLHPDALALGDFP